jgi:Fur family transcriptional regulator, peroxide stress response regulator
MEMERKERAGITQAAERFERMLSRVREQGGRITPQRLAVLHILSENEGHPSVEAIYLQVKKDFPTTSLATVYNTVNLLKELGEVLELGFRDLGSRYDGTKPYPHPHAICLKCGEIADPPMVSLDEMAARIAEETGFRITSHRLDFFGLCPRCRSKEE